MKVLIAEDDDFFLKLLQQVLGPDHEFIVAHDGKEAWAILQGPDAPKLAILDWVMPGLSGPQVCRKVRACAALSSMYLIILTAKNNEADIVSGLRAGADDYITKPPIPAELRARVRVGERILELQALVEAQSVLSNQASGGSATQGLPGQKQLREIEACPRQHCEPGDCCLISDEETESLSGQPRNGSLENRHPHV